MPSRGHRGFSGAAGEYAVASELSRREWLATVTLGNSPHTDVLAWHIEPRALVTVQVKTASPGRRAFQLKTDPHEQTSTETNEWFAFVRLPGDPLLRPTFHLVPANVVAAILYAVRREAESQGKTVGGWRNFLTEWIEEYSEAWELLLTPTTQAVRPLRSDVAAFVTTFGRPEDQAVVQT